MKLTLGLGLAALLAYLALGPKPWNAGIEAARAGGRDVDVLEYAVSGLWWAALANAALLALALGTVRAWLSLAPAPVCAALAAPARRPSAPFVAGLLAAVLVGGTLAWPRLTHSLWADEVFTVMRTVDGYWRPGDGDDLEFSAASWIDTLWYYRMPNNHGPHSILARLSLGAWQRTHPEAPRRFDERALRLPAFAAGIASIAAGGALLWRAGFPAAGLVVAWILALHPWHLRYASEARGYSIVLLLQSAHLLLLLAALHRGTWLRWLGFGAVQAAMLWTYPGIVFALALANLVAALGIALLHRDPDPRRAQLARWVTANVAGAMLWLQLAAPHVPQVLAWMEGDLRYGNVGGRWVSQLAAHLYLGVPWKLRGALPDVHHQLVDAGRGEAEPALLAGGALCLLGVAAGTLRLARAGVAGRLLAPVLLLAGPVTWLAAWLAGVHLRTWYLLFMLPAWAALLALGASWPLALRPRLARAAAAVGLLGALAAYAAASAPVWETLRTRSMQPRRESVAHTRPIADPGDDAHDRILTASFLQEPILYDPRVVQVRDAAELGALMERADRDGLALYVDVGGLLAARRPPEDLVALVVAGDRFEEDAVFHGLVPADTRHVYRYRGRGGADAGVLE